MLANEGGNDRVATHQRAAGAGVVNRGHVRDNSNLLNPNYQLPTAHGNWALELGVPGHFKTAVTLTRARISIWPAAIGGAASAAALCAAWRM